jgi:Alkylmercury lyase
MTPRAVAVRTVPLVLRQGLRQADVLHAFGHGVLGGQEELQQAGRAARGVRDMRDRRARPARHGRAGGRITSADPADGTPIEVTVRDGTWSWTPAGTVVVAARAAGGGSFEVMCPHAVIECGRLNFGTLLTGPA